MASRISCLLCGTLFFDNDDKQRLSSNREDKQRICLFLLRNLLGIPKPFVSDDDRVELSGDSRNEQCSRNRWSNLLVSCEQCTESIRQARLIYSELGKLVKRFRGIQKKIVESFKNSIGTTTGGEPRVLNAVEQFRRLVNDCDYNDFGFPFVVQDEMDHEELADYSTINEGGSENEDDLDLSESIYSKVAIKEEESTDKQEILLIFPEGEEVEEDADDDQSSEVDSEEDDDDQVWQINSEEDSGNSDDEVSQSSSPEETEDEEDNPNEDLDQTQDLQKTDHIEIPAVSEKKSYLKRDPPGAVTENNQLSSFICKKCLQRFATPTELEQHHKTSHSKEQRETYPCPLEGCTRVYTYTGIFAKHFQMHHRKPPFRCKDCQQEFSNPNQVRIHHQQNHPPIQQPIIKPEKIKRQNKLESRIKVKKSPRIRKRRSPKPKKSSGRPRKPLREKKPKKMSGKRCNPDNPFSCPHCPSRLKSFSSLKTHMKNSHPNNPIPLEELRLRYYPPPSTTEPDLPENRKTGKPTKRGHVSTFELQYPHIICTRNSEGKFPCPWTDPSSCPRIFSAKDQLHRHIKVNHLNLPLFTCTWSGGDGNKGGPICGKTFNTRSNYLEHYDQHRGTPGYKCEECGMTFYRRNPFTRHKQKMHLGAKFICENCGQGFTCKEYLDLHKTKKHKSTEHKGTTQHKKVQKDCPDDNDDNAGIICDLCGQVLKNKSTMKVHMLAKHERIPGKYCCHLCGNRYRQTIHLNMHLWQRHQFKVEGYEHKERVGMARKDKFQCPVKGCRMVFSRKESFEKHRIDMHGEDGNKRGPWNCKYCEKNFFWRIKWEHCERTHENKESRPEKCEICGKGFPTKHHLRFHLKYTHKMELESKRGQREQKFMGK